MPAPRSSTDFLDMIRKSGVVAADRLEAHLQTLGPRSALPALPADLAEQLVRDGLLTQFQVEHFLQGKYLGFTLGAYIVRELLGSGGMSAVYLCEHREDQRQVAVKVLPRLLAKDPTLLKRFEREARASVALDHPNIVRGFEAGQEKDQHFFVMEYVAGESLQELVALNGPLGIAQAADYIHQAAVGLQHAHEAGLVHRDIKPGNLLVNPEGVVKILDMGLSRFYNAEDDSVLTKDVLGTLDYLAPEQARDSHQVDIRADIFSLGGTFYFLLSGQSPLGSDSLDQALVQPHRPPKPLEEFRDDVPRQLLAVIEKMMARDPERRYRTPASVANALLPWVKPGTKQIATNSTPRAPRPLTSRAPAKVPAPAPLVTWWALLGVLLGCGLAGAAWWLLRP